MRCPRRESNPQTLGFKPSRSADWRTWTFYQSGPGWTRTTDLLLVRKLPLPLGYRTESNEKWTHRELHPNPRFAGPMSSCWTMSPNIRRRAEAVGLEPTSGMFPPPVFKTGSSSSRMTSVIFKLRELESNQRLRVQSPASLPAATIPQYLFVE